MGAGFQVRWNRPVRMLAPVGLLICAAAPSLPLKLTSLLLGRTLQWDRTKIGYRGAGREKSNDILNRDKTKFGFDRLLAVARAPEGSRFCRPPKLRLMSSKTSSKPLPDGKRFALAVADEVVHGAG